MSFRFWYFKYSEQVLTSCNGKDFYWLCKDDNGNRIGDLSRLYRSVKDVEEKVTKEITEREAKMILGVGEESMNIQSLTKEYFDIENTFEPQDGPPTLYLKGSGKTFSYEEAKKKGLI